MTSSSSTPTPSEIGTVYLLNVTAGTGGTVSPDLSGTYPARERIELIAYPDPGYSFYRWVNPDGDPQDFFFFWRQNPAHFYIQNDMNIMATFKEASELFYLDIFDGPHGGIPVGGARRIVGNYLEKAVIDGLVVRVHEGWSFEGWVVLSKDHEFMGTIERGVTSFTMPPYDVILVAEYKER